MRFNFTKFSLLLLLLGFSFSQDCEDDNEAVSAFGDCATAIGSVGCDFNFPFGSDTYISDFCPDTCDACEESGDDGLSDGCDLPDLNLYLTDAGEVLYNSSEDIGGFQFNVDGATIISGSGGDSADAGFVVSAGANTVLGFSFTGGTLPPGNAVLVDVSFSGFVEEICLSGVRKIYILFIPQKASHQ